VPKNPHTDKTIVPGFAITVLSRINLIGRYVAAGVAVLLVSQTIGVVTVMDLKVGLPLEFHEAKVTTPPVKFWMFKMNGQ